MMHDGASAAAPPLVYNSTAVVKDSLTRTNVLWVRYETHIPANSTIIGAPFKLVMTVKSNLFL